MTKRVRTTSAEAFRYLGTTLQKREELVLNALKGWDGPAPTAYELTEYMRARGQVFDLNGVRPRISSLQERGLVTTGAKRRCNISGRTAFTWYVAQREAQQAGLF